MERYQVFLEPFDPDLVKLEQARLVYEEIISAIQQNLFKSISGNVYDTLTKLNFFYAYNLKNCRIYTTKLEPTLKIMLTPYVESDEHSGVFFPISSDVQIIAINVDDLNFHLFNHEYQHWNTFMRQSSYLDPMLPLEQDGVSGFIHDLKTYANDPDEMNSYFFEEIGRALERIKLGEYTYLKSYDKNNIIKHISNDIFYSSHYYEDVFKLLTKKNQNKMFKRIYRYADKYLVSHIKEYI